MYHLGSLCVDGVTDIVGWVFDILVCASLRQSDCTGVLEKVVDVGGLLNPYARLISAWRFLLGKGTFSQG